MRYMRLLWRGWRRSLGRPLLGPGRAISFGGGLALGFRNLLRSQFEHGFSHFLAGLEFNDSAGGDWHIRGGSIRIAAHSGFSNFHFENPEIPQFHFLSPCHGIGYVVQRLLDDGQHILLNEPGLLADSHYQVTLCHSGCVG